MALGNPDLQFMKSVKMTDFNDGGGRMSGDPVIDGKLNEVFEDISDMDHTYGRVNIRKIFLAVRSALNELYLGANVILSGRPRDPNVSVTLFSTGDWNDERDDAQNHLENYLTRGGRWHGWLYGDQIAGQRAIQIWQRPELELPAIGSVLCLVANFNKADEYEQYVRITRLAENIVRNFTHSDGTNFQRRVLTLEISDALRRGFGGAQVTPFDAEADAQSKTVVLRTVVADAAHYYGVSELADNASRGAMRIRVQSIMSQLVPSARTEIAATDASAAGESAALIPSGDGVISYTYAATFSPIVALNLERSFQPGTLSIDSKSGVLTDRGGELMLGNVAIGSANYARGLLQIAPGGPTIDGSKTIRFKPAAAPIRVGASLAIPIRPETRSYTYTVSLSPAPAPGSVLISFLAQGNWYDQRDTGNGAAKGADPSFGTSNINYQTGSVVITCGALPDVNSVVMVTWATRVNYFNRATFAPSRPAFAGSLGIPLTPGGLVAKWSDGTKEMRAVDNGSGQWTGDATGTITYLTGDYRLCPSTTPLAGAEFEFTGSAGDVPDDVVVETFNNPVHQPDGSIVLQLQKTGIQPGALLSYNLAPPHDAVSTALKKYTGSPGVATGISLAGGSFDLINAHLDAATGRVTLWPDKVVPCPVDKYRLSEPMIGSSTNATGGSRQYVFDGYTEEMLTCSLPRDGSGYVTVQYRTSNSSAAFTVTHTLDVLTFDLTDRYAERITSEAVRFTYAGQAHIDRSGRIFNQIDPTTGIGFHVGNIDYGSGLVTLEQWMPGQPNEVTVQSLLTEIGGAPVSSLTFRVPFCPLQPGSFWFTAAALSGEDIRVDTDGDSEHVSNVATVKMDYATGVIQCDFGRKVTAAGNELQPWYDPDAVDGDGKIWKPLPVLADTLRYGVVGYSYMPLEADILGLDTVRLPPDGKVPIFRKGDMIVLQHNGTLALPASIETDTVYSVSRERLSRLRVVDKAGKAMAEEKYRADLDNGEVEFNAPLDLAGLTPPLSIEHRIEDAAVIFDVQISGDIVLNKQLSHNFPAGETLVASALKVGDMQARAHTVFSQQSWGNRWQDTIDGAPTTSQYNITQYPITVTNKGAVQERWAIIFNNVAGSFRVVGESLGQIAEGSINADLAPVNPYSGTPYFTIRAAGWGGGWASQNVLRFNTAAANYPVQLARTVLMGASNLDVDGCQVQSRGNANKSS